MPALPTLLAGRRRPTIDDLLGPKETVDDILGPEQGYAIDKARRLGRAVPVVIGQVIASPGSALQAATTLGGRVLTDVAKRRGDLTEEEAIAARQQLDAELSLRPELQAAQALRDVGAEVAQVGPRHFAAPDRLRDNELGSAVVSGAASLVPTLASLGAGPAGPILANAGMMGESQREDAAARGATPDQQAAAFAMGGATGVASEAVLGAPAMMRGLRGANVLPKALGAVEAAGDQGVAQMLGSVLPAVVPMAQQFVKNAVREGIQEGLEQIAGNVVAKDVVGYDEKRDRTEGLGMAMAAGGIVGGGVGAAYKAADQLADKLDTGKNVPESEATLKAQQEQLLAGRRQAQMFPKGSRELPLPEGMQRTETERGVFHFDPGSGLTAEKIAALSADGRENEIIGYGSQSKQDVEARAAKGDPRVTVTERTPEGVEVKAVLSTRGTAEEIAAQLEKSKTPGNRIAVEPVERVPAERKSAIQEMLDAEAERMAKTREAEAAEVKARTERQTQLRERAGRFDQQMEQARAVMARPDATFAEVRGAAEAARYYAEDNSLGLNLDQTRTAKAAQLALEARLEKMQPAENARRDAEIEAQLKQEAEAKAKRKAEAQQLEQTARTGRNPQSGNLEDLRALPLEELQTLDLSDERNKYLPDGTEVSETMVTAELERRGQEEERSAAAAPDRTQYTWEEYLRSHPLPRNDAALQGELDKLAEEMTPAQRMRFFRQNAADLDRLAEGARDVGGFADVQTPADVIANTQRMLRGETIVGRRSSGDMEVEFATGGQNQAEREFQAARTEANRVLRRWGIQPDQTQEIVDDILRGNRAIGDVSQGIPSVAQALQRLVDAQVAKPSFRPQSASGLPAPRNLIHWETDPVILEKIGADSTDGGWVAVGPNMPDENGLYLGDNPDMSQTDMIEELAAMLQEVADYSYEEARAMIGMAPQGAPPAARANQPQTPARSPTPERTPGARTAQDRDRAVADVLNRFGDNLATRALITRISSASRNEADTIIEQYAQRDEQRWALWEIWETAEAENAPATAVEDLPRPSEVIRKSREKRIARQQIEDRAIRALQDHLPAPLNSLEKVRSALQDYGRMDAGESSRFEQQFPAAMQPILDAYWRQARGIPQLTEPAQTATPAPTRPNYGRVAIENGVPIEPRQATDPREPSARLIELLRQSTGGSSEQQAREYIRSFLGVNGPSAVAYVRQFLDQDLRHELTALWEANNGGSASATSAPTATAMPEMARLREQAIQMLVQTGWGGADPALVLQQVASGELRPMELSGQNSADTTRLRSALIQYRNAYQARERNNAAPAAPARPAASTPAPAPAAPAPTAADREQLDIFERLGAIMERLAKNEEVWKFGKGAPTAKTLGEIAAHFSTDNNRLTVQSDGDMAWKIATVDSAGVSKGQLYVSVSRGGVVTVNASSAGSDRAPDNGGKNAYQAINTFAHNNGWKVQGSSLSRKNELRRTVNMLSSALRHGTTRHLIPYTSQRITPWEDETTATAKKTAYRRNIGAMLSALSRIAAQRAPVLNSLTYDLATDTVVETNEGKVRRISDTQLDRILDDAKTGKAEGIGPATARAILLARAEMAAGARGNRQPTAAAMARAARGSLGELLYARGEAGAANEPGTRTRLRARRELARALPGPDAGPLSEAQLDQELEALRKAFPELLAENDVQLANVERALAARGYKGKVPADVQAAILRARGERTMIVIGARHYRDRAKGAALLTHEMAHPYWNTLPEATREELRELHRREMRDKSGPLYVDRKLNSELQYLEDDNENGHREWFAERIARLNESWAKGKMDVAEQNVIRRLAHRLREFLRKLWSKMARKDGIDPESKLFVDGFRQFFASGGQVPVGRSAGMAYATKGGMGPENSQLEGFHADLRAKIADKIANSTRSDYAKGDILYTPRGTPVEFITDLLPERRGKNEGASRALVRLPDGSQSSILLGNLSPENPRDQGGAEFATGQTPEGERDPLQKLEAKLVDVRPGDRIAEARAKSWIDVMPAFQGGKYQMAEAAAKIIREQFTQAELDQIETVNDYFGGGGMWGAYLALSHFKKAARVVVHEFDPLRAAKIELYHTRGNEIRAILKQPEVQDLIETAVQLANADETTSGTALAARLAQNVDGATGDVRAVAGALIDAAMGARGRAADARGVKTAEATAEKIVGIVIRDAEDAHRGIKELESRGATVERRTGDSYAQEPAPGGRTVAVMDPPYYRTTGYDGSQVGLALYSRTAEMVRRMAAAGNAVVYTDSAWQVDNPNAATNDQPGRRLLGSIVDSLGAFGIVQPQGADRHELIGINRPGQSEQANALPPIDPMGNQNAGGLRPDEGNRPDAKRSLFDGVADTGPVAAADGSEGGPDGAASGSGENEAGRDQLDEGKPERPPTALESRYDAMREDFDRATADVDRVQAEIARLESDTTTAPAELRARRGELADARRSVADIYRKLVELRAELDAATPTKVGGDAAKIIETIASQEARPKDAVYADHLAEWRMQRERRDKARRVGNTPEEDDAQRRLAVQERILDDLNPSWKDDAYAKGKARILPPPPPAEPAAADESDLEASPFAEPEREVPVRFGKLDELYGQSGTKPHAWQRWSERVMEVVRGFRGSVPELPVFSDAWWNRSDGFIQEHGAHFYDGIKAFYRKLTGSNDAIQRTAEQQIADIVRPLMEADGPFAAADYTKLQRLHERVRRAVAEQKEVPATAWAEIRRLNRKLEEHPYVLFSRAVLALDLNWRQMNLKNSSGDPIALPANLNDAEIGAELRRIDAAIKVSPHEALLRTALRQHTELVKKVADDLVERGLMAVEALRNPFYFPHVTLERQGARGVEQRELKPERVRPDTEADFRGYLVDPVGSNKPIETDYLQAMYYHLVQVGAHNLKMDAIAEFARPYDVMSQVKQRATELSKRRGYSVSWEQAFHEEFAPRGYVLYGTNSRDAFPTITINRDLLARRVGQMITSESLQDQLKELGLKDIKLTADDLRETLMQGERETWVVPGRVAEALRNIAERQTPQSGLIDTVAKKTMQVWKGWKLFAPWNHIRYEFNNWVADAEKIASAAPRTFRFMPQAARELRDYWLGGKPGADLAAAVRENVINTITAQEMGGLQRLPNFREFEPWHARLAEEAKAVATSPLTNATRLFSENGALGRVTSVEFSAYREAVVRYAKFLSDLDALRNGARPEYAGAYWKDIEAIGDSRRGANDAQVRKAAQISKSTFGDYGDLSVTGQAIRDKLIPFYSWTEVNFKYHANLLRNLRDMVRAHELSGAEAAKAGARAAAVFGAGLTARTAGGILLRLTIPYLAAITWNSTGDRDEIEEELSEEDRRRFHIIIGRNADGTANVVYGSTALMDVLRWFNGPQFVQAMSGWANGRHDFNQALTAWRDRLVPDLLNNTIGAATPWLKTPYTVLSGKNSFPDVTDQRTIPAYDMRRVVLGQITDEFVADRIESAINKDYYGAKDMGKWVNQLVWQMRNRDSEAWAFYAIKDKAADWMERQTGKSRESNYDAPEQQVLRNFRRAIYRGDATAAVQFYHRALEYGYTAERFQASIRAQDPLAGLPKENGLRQKFVASLTATDRTMLERAYRHYDKINAGRGQEVALFPKERWGQSGMDSYRAAPRDAELQRLIEREGSEARAEQALRDSLRVKR
jgi:hypothetical protein